MSNRRIQQNIDQISNADHQKRRYHTVTGSKLVKTTANNKKNLSGQQHQPIRKLIQEVQQTLHHQPPKKERRSQNTNKTLMLSNTTKSTTNTLPPTRRRKKRIEQIIRIRTSGEIRNYRRRLFRVSRGN